jgi:hypothetical protein
LASLPENSGWAYWFDFPGDKTDWPGNDDGSDRDEVAMGPAALSFGEFASVNASLLRFLTKIKVKSADKSEDQTPR